VNVSQRNKKLSVYFDPDFFEYFATRGCSYVGVVWVAPASWKDKRTWIIAEMSWAATQVNLNPERGIPYEGNRCGRNWFNVFSHNEQQRAKSKEQRAKSKEPRAKR